MHAHRLREAHGCLDAIAAGLVEKVLIPRSLHISRKKHLSICKDLPAFIHLIISHATLGTLYIYIYIITTMISKGD